MLCIALPEIPYVDCLWICKSDKLLGALPLGIGPSPIHVIGTTDENLGSYTQWLLGERAEGWDVVDIHTPMRAALETGRAKDPAFLLAKDGVHPGREGHWIMAREILAQCFGAKFDGIEKAEELFSRNGDEIRKLVAARRSVLFAAYMTKIGHQRPGFPGHPQAKPGSSIEEASAKAADLTRQIEELLK